MRAVGVAFRSARAPRVTGRGDHEIFPRPSLVKQRRRRRKHNAPPGIAAQAGRVVPLPGQEWRVALYRVRPPSVAPALLVVRSLLSVRCHRSLRGSAPYTSPLASPMDVAKPPASRWSSARRMVVSEVEGKALIEPNAAPLRTFCRRRSSGADDDRYENRATDDSTRRTNARPGQPPLAPTAPRRIDCMNIGTRLPGRRV
jgi:hypothetical protein